MNASQDPCPDFCGQQGQSVPLAKCSLLNRRICYYVISKLRLSKNDLKNVKKHTDFNFGASSDGRSAMGFYNNFLTHDAYEASELNKLIADKTWLSKLLDFQRQSLETLRLCLDPSPQFYQALQSSIEKDANISAEQCLQDPAWVKLVPLQDLIMGKQSLSLIACVTTRSAVPCASHVMSRRLELDAFLPRPDSECIVPEPVHVPSTLATESGQRPLSHHVHAQYQLKVSCNFGLLT